MNDTEATDISEADRAEAKCSAAPCVVCGTTGGYVPANGTAPLRARGACNACYKRYRKAGRLEELSRAYLDAQSFLDRLLAGRVPIEDGGCILWPGTTSDGYAQIRRGGIMVPVTHVVLEAFEGPPPSPLHEAAHAPHEVCGNRHCVNIDHLRWATHAENIADRGTDGTTARGDHNGNARLTEQEVAEIRRSYASGRWTQEEIAARHGVSQSTVGRTVRNETWEHVQ